MVIHIAALTGMWLQDCYIGGALRIVTCQQTFDLKPLRNNGIFLYRERCTIMDSQVLEFPPVLAQSAYAATFFPERYRTSTPRACSEVRQGPAPCLACKGFV